MLLHAKIHFDQLKRTIVEMPRFRQIFNERELTFTFGICYRKSVSTATQRVPRIYQILNSKAPAATAFSDQGRSLHATIDSSFTLPR